MKAYRGPEVQLHYSWPRYYAEVSGHFYAPSASSPVKGDPCSHSIEDWVSPRAGLSIVEKNLSLARNPGRPVCDQWPMTWVAYERINGDENEALQERRYNRLKDESPTAAAWGWRSIFLLGRNSARTSTDTGDFSWSSSVPRSEFQGSTSIGSRVLPSIHLCSLRGYRVWDTGSVVK
jgi:hypothetical protein